MKKLVLQCDNCGKTDPACEEFTLSFERKAWASDFCPSCLTTVLDWLKTWGMEGPQKRKLPGTSVTAKGTAAPAKKQAVKSSDSPAKAKAQSYKGRKCRGCKELFPTQSGRRVHNSRTGCV